MKRSPAHCKPSSNAFTRVDLGCVLGVTLCLAVLVIAPWIVRAGPTEDAVLCVNNLRQLGVAWQAYTEDNGGRLVNNMGMVETLDAVGRKTYNNWNLNVIDWSTNPANTNQNLIRSNRLFQYVGGNVQTFQCPADTYVSSLQIRRGWTRRVRSYSMNGFVGAGSGSLGHESYRGENSFNPGYRQFLLQSAIPSPSMTYVLLDEHPNSINEGYYINQVSSSSQWVDFPGSNHDGGVGIQFADGAAEVHLWSFPSTRQPVKIGAVINSSIPTQQRGDFQWLAERASVSTATMGVHRRENNTAEVVWAQYPTSFALESLNLDSGEGWKKVEGTPVRGLGRSSLTVSTAEGTTLYRLVR